MGSLEEFAKRELMAAGLFDADGDYNGDLGAAVMELVSTFAKQGHSGHSAAMAIHIFKKIASYEPIAPLTGEDAEWCEVADGLFQNVRCPHVFKQGGEAYDIEGIIWEDEDGTRVTNYESRVVVLFPYSPKLVVMKRSQEAKP